TAGTAANFAMPARPQNRLLPPKRIALVHPNAKPEELAINGRRAYHAFFVALNTAGYVEGQNLTVERYSAFGQIEHYEDVVRAAVASQPDLIICIGGTLTRILKPLTSTIPLVVVTP